MSTRTIELSQGYVATVDAEDYDRLMEGPKWRASIARRADGSIRRVYAIRHVRRADGTRTTEAMHRTVLTAASVVDHRDGDGLNNTRTNLRPASNAENQQNAPRWRTNTSGYKGVGRRVNRWRVQIGVGGRLRYVGHYVDIQDAARAYDDAARDLFGEFACLNFPRPGERSALTGEIVPAEVPALLAA